jgi:hypothetical protein
MRHRLLLLLTVIIALAAVPTATADPPDWVPSREIIPYQPDHTVFDQCAFPVLWQIEGPEFDLHLHRDGSGSAMVTGQGAWHDGNPLTGEAGIWYQTGRVSTTWDAAGNTTSLTNAGSLVNLCPVLAS